MKRFFIGFVFLSTIVLLLAAIVRRIDHSSPSVVSMELPSPRPDDRKFRIRILGKSGNWGCAVDKTALNEKLVLTTPDDANRQLVAFDPQNDRRDYDDAHFIAKGTQLVLDPRTQTYLQFFYDLGDTRPRQFFGRDGLYLFILSASTDDIREKIRVDASCKVFVWQRP